MHATDRRPRRAAPPRRDRPRASTSRSTCCPRRCPGWSTTPARYVAGGVAPTRMGNAHPSLFPYDAAADRRRRADHHRRQRRPVPQAVRGARACPSWPTTRGSPRNADRTANREELRPLLVERLATRTKDEWFRELIAAGVPCGPINTVDDGVAFAEELGLDPVVRPGRRSPRSATRSRSPRPRPATCCRRPGSTSTAPRSAPGSGREPGWHRRPRRSPRPRAERPQRSSDRARRTRPRSAPPTPTTSGCSATTSPTT